MKKKLKAADRTAANEAQKDKKREKKPDDQMDRDQLISNITSDIDKFDKSRFNEITSKVNVNKMQKIYH